MTRLEKLQEIDAMANLLDHIVQDCNFCPCMEDGICDGCCRIGITCVQRFKEYLSKEYED